jgi:hypothetical protein
VIYANLSKRTASGIKTCQYVRTRALQLAFKSTEYSNKKDKSNGDARKDTGVDVVISDLVEMADELELCGFEPQTIAKSTTGLVCAFHQGETDCMHTIFLKLFYFTCLKDLT